MLLILSLAVIRPFLPSDAAAVAHHANNHNIWRNVRDIFPHPYSIEDAEKFLGFVLSRDPQMTFAIATSKEAIGCIGLRPGEDVHRKTAELGYWLAEPYWGQGIMAEAVTKFTGWAFENFDFNRIYAEPFEGNIASIKVLQKAGFQLEGRMRQHVFKAEKVMDSYLYSRLRSDV